MNKINLFIGAVMLLLTISFSNQASAQPDFGEERFTLGLQASFPAWGFSAKKNLNEKYAVQGIVGFLGGGLNLTGRGLLKFQTNQYWCAYGYGGITLWNYSGGSAVGFGAGVGIEYDWRKLDDDLPPIYWNAEFGISLFNDDAYDYSAIGIGIGAHYAF